jgi:hypothetical protein
MSKSKKTDDLSNEELISNLKGFHQLILTIRILSGRVKVNLKSEESRKRTRLERMRIKRDLSELIEKVRLFEAWATSFNKEIIGLKFPKPYNVLHFGEDWFTANEAEREDVVNRTEAELLRLLFEAEALISKTTSSKAETENLTDISQNISTANELKTFYSKYPLRDGYIKQTYQPHFAEAGIEAEEFYPFKILSDVKQRIVCFFLGYWSDDCKVLKEFLIQHNLANEDNCDSLTWDDILNKLHIFARKEQIPQEVVLSYPKATYQEYRTTTKESVVETLRKGDFIEAVTMMNSQLAQRIAFEKILEKNAEVEFAKYGLSFNGLKGKEENGAAERILQNIANEVASILLINRTKFELYKDSFHKEWTTFQKAIKKTKYEIGKPVSKKLLDLDPQKKLRIGIDAMLPETQKEQLWRSYIWLIIIHDNLLKSNVPIDSSKDKPLKELYWIIQGIITDTGEKHPILRREGDNKSGITYIESALAEVKTDVNKLKEQSASSGKAGDKINKQFLSLKSFIEIHCDLTAKPDVQSKVSLLHEYNLKKKIKLPELAHKYQKGQHKYYYVDDLKKNWATYQRKMPTLPPLKQPEN